MTRDPGLHPLDEPPAPAAAAATSGGPRTDGERAAAVAAARERLRAHLDRELVALARDEDPERVLAEVRQLTEQLRGPGGR